MSKKSLLQEAIAEAKAIRETAIASAYRSLEENLTPSIKEMLANKLEENFELDENEEEQLSEDVNAGFKKVSAPKSTVKEAEDSEEEGVEDVPEEPEAEEEGSEEDLDDSEEDPDGAVEDVPAEPETDIPSDDESISNLTVGELKNLITDLVQQASAPAPEGDLGVDMEVGDVEGAGEEEAPLEGEPEMDDPAASNEVSPEEADDEEIDLSELLKELESEESKDPRGKYHRGGVGNADQDEVSECTTTDPGKGKKFVKLAEEEGESIEEVRKELQEAYSVIAKLRNTLAETNLLNGKLMYTTKLFNESTLSESQKANIIASLDRAKTLKEAKIVYKTLSENINEKPKKSRILREHRGSSSKPAGKSTAAPVVEGDVFVRRMQELAGIL